MLSSAYFWRSHGIPAVLVKLPDFPILHSFAFTLAQVVTNYSTVVVLRLKALESTTERSTESKYVVHLIFMCGKVHLTTRKNDVPTSTNASHPRTLSLKVVRARPGFHQRHPLQALSEGPSYFAPIMRVCVCVSVCSTELTTGLRRFTSTGCYGEFSTFIRVAQSLVHPPPYRATAPVHRGTQSLFQSTRILNTLSAKAKWYEVVLTNHTVLSRVGIA